MPAVWSESTQSVELITGEQIARPDIHKPLPGLRFELLDAIRGFAAFWVLTFHFPFSAAFQQHLSWVHAFTRSGYLGVEIFFVVSGYCIAAAALRGLAKGESALLFLWRRVLRIYPTFWCSVILVVLFPLLKAKLIGGNGRPLFADNTLWDWVLIGTLAQAFVDPLRPLNEKFQHVNVVYWTLAVEVQFYLAATIAYACRSWFWWIVGGLAALGLPMAINGAPQWLNTGCFLPYWPHFALGALLYALQARGWIASHESGTRIRMGCKILLLGAVFGICGWLMSGRHIPSLAFSLLTMAGLWCLLSLEEGSDRIQLRRLTMLAPFWLLGAMSYSLYLIHFNLPKLPEMFWQRVLPSSGILRDIAVILSTIALTYPFYWFCERPFQRSARNPPRRTPELAHNH